MLQLVAVFVTPELALLPHIPLAVLGVLPMLNLLEATLASPLPVLNVLADVHGC